jgi:hypothetical protein
MVEEFSFRTFSKPREFFYIIQLFTHNESKDYLYLVDFTHMTMTMAGTSFCLELERHEEGGKYSLNLNIGYHSY